MADIYSTNSEGGKCKDTESLIKPFICGYCKSDFEAFEKFYIHLKSHDVHIKKYGHACDSSLMTEDLDSHSSCVITCMCCLGQFGNVCQLHEHILKCTGEGSYFYLQNNERKAAYPIGSLCDIGAARTECTDVESGLPHLVESKGNIRKGLNKVIKGLWLENGITSKQINGKEKTEGFKDVSMDTNDLESYVENKNVTQGKLASERSDLQQKRSRKNKSSQTKLYVNVRQIVVGNYGSDLKAHKESDNNELKVKGSMVEDVIANKGEETAMCKNFDEVLLGNIKERFDDSDNNDKIEEKGRKSLKTKCNKVSGKNDTVKNCKVLDLHKKKARGRKKLPREVCKKCGKEILQKDLEVHENMHNNHEKTTVCKICGEEVQRDELKTHKKGHLIDTKKVNNALRLIVCHICGKDVPQGQLKQHVSSHSKEQPHKCSLCPKAFKSSHYLRTHIKNHSSVMSFFCEVCGKGFAHDSSFRHHILRHSDVLPFTCETCGAGFVAKYKLKRHMLTHTGNQRVKCNLCSMMFTRQDNLSTHIAGVHKGERRFTCEECGKKFFTNYQLKCHYMKHSGLRPHKCAHCNADFIERKELRRHMLKQHNMTLDAKIFTDSMKAEDVLAALRQKNNEEVIVMSAPSDSTHADLKLEHESFSNSETDTLAENDLKCELLVITNEGLDDYVETYEEV